MKKTKEKIDNTIINNLNVETRETTPEDGFVPEREIKTVNMHTHGKYHKGYAKTKAFSTNDPRITRPFLYIMCGIFFVIGIFMLLVGNWFFGIIFSISAILVFVDGKKDIDKIAKKLKNEGQDVTIDSVAEKEQLKKEVIDNFKESANDIKSTMFTKDNFKQFSKNTIPIYCVVVAIIVILISIFVNIFLGLFLLIILGLGGFLYYYLISKLFKN